MTFGEALLQILDERGTNVNQFAEDADIPKQSLYSLVYGKSKEPSLGRAKQIADALGMTLDELAERVYR